MFNVPRCKIHQAFLCYKDNYQANFYLCPYFDLLRVVVLVPSNAPIKLHKFVLCVDDMNCYIGCTKRKYAFDKLAIPKIWFIQAKTNITQNEIRSFEETWFVLNKW